MKCQIKYQSHEIHVLRGLVLGVTLGSPGIAPREVFGEMFAIAPSGSNTIACDIPCKVFLADCRKAGDFSFRRLFMYLIFKIRRHEGDPSPNSRIRLKLAGFGRFDRE